MSARPRTACRPFHGAALLLGLSLVAAAQPAGGAPPRDDARGDGPRGAPVTASPALRARVKAVLSAWRADALTAADARAIHAALREAGVAGGPEENDAVRAAGFSPERLRELDPPPARPGEARPPPPTGPSTRAPTSGPGGPPKYSLAQATSDEAQLRTIAFDGLAFLTGDFGLDTFLPPGKVSDYFGFQWLRDVDAPGAGHSTDFLTRIAHAVLSILDDAQRAQLLALAQAQQDDLRRFALQRLPLMKAFRRLADGTTPAGRPVLSRRAVVEASQALYELDGRLALQRAKTMGQIVRTLSPDQRAALATLRFGDSSTWPERANPIDRRGLPHDVDVAVMTYASELFSWYAGSVEADTYFCPERHGAYFGGFGMKTAPVAGTPHASISTRLTADSGAAFLAGLTEAQRLQVTALVDAQRDDLAGIVEVRRELATRLRGLQRAADAADEAGTLALARRYGALDGDLSWRYATAFAAVGHSLSPAQRATFQAMREPTPANRRGPFLYATPFPDVPVGNTDFFFEAP